MLDARLVSDDDPVANLQLALGIELAVLPPYLYALWSIKPPSEGASWAATEAAASLRGVIYQEMLHVALVGNVLNAMKGRPNVSAHPMTYPGPLPGHVTDGKYAFRVHLDSLSPTNLKTFRRIERPEWDLEAEATGGWITIGAFYEKLKGQLAAPPRNPFDGGHQLPAGDSPGPGRLVAVDDLNSALAAVTIVVHQGEGHAPPASGKAADENDDDHEVAHYYQFGTIKDYIDQNLIRESDLYPVVRDPNAALYSPAQRLANDRFNQTYSELLTSLQAMFDAGSPQAFGPPTALMSQLSHQAALLREAGTIPGTSHMAGPTFATSSSTAGAA